ncbi:MAG: alkaline phosphatase family protein [Vicinamibacterales bacterium]
MRAALRRSSNRPRVAATVLVALALAAGLPPAGNGTLAQDDRPTLLVLVVVDQMRNDYLTRFDARFTDGFRRLVREGRYFEQTFYPYLNTVTCAGHATLGTGAWPKTHGIILNEWYRRELGRVRSCTADNDTTPVPYNGIAEKEGHSARELRVPTLAERLRARWPQSRSVSLAVKPRSAVMMAGRSATAVTWVGASGWQSSTAFTSAPLPEVVRALGPHPFERERTLVWERLLEPAAYTGTDEGLGERPPTGWTARFPHPLLSPEHPKELIELWQTSPYADAQLATVAASLIESYQLGRRDAVDFLAVSFPATDKVGHDFGPESHELQDTLIRLDRTLGTLLTTLDRLVGRNRWALALSSDHGVAPVPEQRRAAGESGGRVALATVGDAVNTALTAAGLGPGPHVARVEYTEVYLTEATRAKVTADAIAPALAAIRALPGVRTAVWTPALTMLDATDPVVRAMQAGFVPGRSGDITLAPAPYWILVPGRNPAGGNATTHGSSNEYDQHVPLVFLGGPFPPGRVRDAATPADAAPTLAATVGLTLDGIEGRPLAAATRR